MSPNYINTIIKSNLDRSDLDKDLIPTKNTISLKTSIYDLEVENKEAFSDDEEEKEMKRSFSIINVTKLYKYHYKVKSG